MALTLCAALILVYVTAEQTTPAFGGNTGSTTSTVSTGSTGSTGSELDSEQTSKGGEAATQGSEKEPEAEKPKIKPTTVDGKDFVLTAAELSELADIIHKAEDEVYYTPTASDQKQSDAETAASAADKAASAAGTSSKEMKPPPQKRSISIYFEDLTSGYSYQYNAEKKYFIASLIKAPYCMYLFTLAEQGKCDLTEKITVNQKDVKPGTGSIVKKKAEEFPFDTTVRELMSLAIRESDNTAMELLRKKYPHDGYLPFAKGLSIKYPDDVRHMVDGSITAYDAGMYARALYDYMENGKYGGELKEDMMNTGNAMIRANAPIARKYGWAELSFHDMAVVFEEAPYVLAICTDATIGKQADYKLFADISNAFARFHKKRYG